MEKVELLLCLETLNVVFRSSNKVSFTYLSFTYLSVELVLLYFNLYLCFIVHTYLY